MRLRPRLLPTVLSVAILSLTGAQIAVAQFDGGGSSSTVNPGDAPSATDLERRTQPNQSSISSSVVLDSNNLARSFARDNVFGRLEAGAEVRSSHGSTVPSNFFHSDANTSADFRDHWTGGGGAIGQPIPMSFAFDLNGTASKGGFSFIIDYSAHGLGEFRFNFLQDGPPTVRATFRNIAGVTSNLPFSLTTDASGNVAFSLDVANLPVFLCVPGCSGGLSFDDSLSIDAQVFSEGTPEFIDGFDTFTVGLTTLDPRFEFVSDSGRSTAPIGGVSAVPERSSLLLLMSGLLGLTCIYAQRSRRENTTVKSGQSTKRRRKIS